MTCGLLNGMQRKLLWLPTIAAIFVMNKDEPPETGPDDSKTPRTQRPDYPPKPPVPDGEAIAEVGDAVGGPA
jgi:hypothetical protein